MSEHLVEEISQPDCSVHSVVEAEDGTCVLGNERGRARWGVALCEEASMRWLVGWLVCQFMLTHTTHDGNSRLAMSPRKS